MAIFNPSSSLWLEQQERACERALGFIPSSPASLRWYSTSEGTSHCSFQSLQVLKYLPVSITSVDQATQGIFEKRKGEERGLQAGGGGEEEEGC